MVVTTLRRGGRRERAVVGGILFLDVETYCFFRDRHPVFNDSSRNGCCTYVAAVTAGLSRVRAC